MTRVLISILAIFLIVGPFLGHHAVADSVPGKSGPLGAVHDSAHEMSTDNCKSECDDKDFQGCCSVAVVHCSSVADTHRGWVLVAQTSSMRAGFFMAPDNGNLHRFHEIETPPPRV